MKNIYLKIRITPFKDHHEHVASTLLHYIEILQTSFHDYYNGGRYFPTNYSPGRGGGNVMVKLLRKGSGMGVIPDIGHGVNINDIIDQIVTQETHKTELS